VEFLKKKPRSNVLPTRKGFGGLKISTPRSIKKTPEHFSLMPTRPLAGGNEIPWDSGPNISANPRRIAIRKNIVSQKIYSMEPD
jgi:hypothetical protein